MGMSPKEFYDYLPKYFWLKLEGNIEAENLKERKEWERLRWQTTLLLNVHMSKNKTLKPTDLIEFEWDKKDVEVDFEQLKAKAEFIKKMEEHGK